MDCKDSRLSGLQSPAKSSGGKNAKRISRGDSAERTSGCTMWKSGIEKMQNMQLHYTGPSGHLASTLWHVLNTRRASPLPNRKLEGRAAIQNFCGSCRGHAKVSQFLHQIHSLLSHHSSSSGLSSPQQTKTPQRKSVILWREPREFYWVVTWAQRALHALIIC